MTDIRDHVSNEINQWHHVLFLQEITAHLTRKGIIKTLSHKLNASIWQNNGETRTTGGYGDGVHGSKGK